MIKTAVVILNWNGRAFLEKFLPSVIQHTTSYAEIIIADNASTDDSISFLKKHYPEIQIVQNEENGGFAKGYNDALRRIEADYYVLLNSDIEVTKNWISPVIDLMESDPLIAACQPKLRAYHETEKFEYAGASGGFIDKYGYPFCRGRIFQKLETDHSQYEDATDVFWATGACLFVRAKLYHELGGLDEDFFAHMEEIDFCWRLHIAGYRVMVQPQSVVYHVGGGTLPKKSSRKTYLNFRNNFYLLSKNLPTSRLLPVFFVRIILDAVAALKFLADGQLADFFAVTKAYFSFFRHLPVLFRYRKSHKHSHVPHMYQKSIVYEHYIKKRNTFSELDSSLFS